MVKFICDKCGEEVKSIYHIHHQESVVDALMTKLMEFPRRTDLCSNCNELYKRLNLNIAEFMEKPKEELDLLDGTFKVGDEVITADGRVGVIKSICDCEHCKKRGFYEPEVELTTGYDTIWITDFDKNNGFKRFYKIGEQFFGNIDDDAFYNLRDRINECKKEIIDSEAQLKVLKQLQEDKKGCIEDDNWLDDIIDF